MKNPDKPSIPTKVQGTRYYGLSKREYFAAMAMQGLLANSSVVIKESNIAQGAVMLADQLLNELEDENN